MTSPIFGNVKLGREPSRRDPRTLMGARYLKEVPAPPANCDYGKPVKSWPMLDNDRWGDCTCAAAGHATQLWTANNGKEITPSTRSVLTAYEKVTGFNPKQPSTDQGAQELDVLKYWQKVGIARHKLLAYAAMKPAAIESNAQALYAFGCLYLGLALPRTAMHQNAWDVVPGAGKDAKPGSWGGHAVIACAYHSEFNTITIVTWNQTITMTQRFWNEYVEESWAPIGADWVKNGKAPNSVDLATLNADLQALAA